MKKLIAVIVGSAFMLAACNTMEGLGRDVERGGQKIENKAQDAKRN